MRSEAFLVSALGFIDAASHGRADRRSSRAAAVAQGVAGRQASDSGNPVAAAAAQHKW